MKYIGCETTAQAFSLLYLEMLAKEKKEGKKLKGKLHPNGIRVKKDGDGGATIVVAKDDQVFESKIKDKVKDTEAEAKADKVEKTKAKTKKK